MKMSF
jgi:hypothetical protein